MLTARRSYGLLVQHSIQVSRGLILPMQTTDGCSLREEDSCYNMIPSQNKSLQEALCDNLYGGMKQQRPNGVWWELPF